MSPAKKKAAKAVDVARPFTRSDWAPGVQVRDSQYVSGAHVPATALPLHPPSKWPDLYVVHVHATHSCLTLQRASWSPLRRLLLRAAAVQTCYPRRPGSSHTLFRRLFLVFLFFKHHYSAELLGLFSFQLCFPGARFGKAQVLHELGVALHTTKPKTLTLARAQAPRQQLAISIPGVVQRKTQGRGRSPRLRAFFFSWAASVRRG